jgi:hypothetical protein
MRRLRDVFYISANFQENYFIYYGMEFKEFVSFNPVKMKNILITDGNFTGNNFNGNWMLETSNGCEGILELCEEDIYGLGNFHWIDYSDEVSLNNCSPEEKSEIIYLSHFCEPLKSPFFDKINNDFFYLAHDDGWFCKLYCKDMFIFRDILINKIIDNFFAKNRRRKIYPMSEDIKDVIFDLTKEGLLLDFSNLYTDKRCIELAFYSIGHYEDMDEMYNNLEQSKNRASIKGRIEYKNKTWKVYFYDK